MTMQLEQGTFDIDALLAEVNPAPPRPTYAGRAPLGFTVEYFTLDELDEAMSELRATADGQYTLGMRHHWHRGFSGGSQHVPGHALEFIEADLRCWCLLLPPYGFNTRECFCVGDQVTRVLCETCRWHHIGTERACVAAAHDHTFPGWRDLPVVPLELAGEESRKKRDAWISANYPEGWGTEGAPIVTARDKWGTRSVPKRSPWGGYDISETALEEPHSNHEGESK